MTALRKLLVVDDDPVVGASFNRVLSGKGYIVVSAENGAEALAKLQAEKFDAVFTDLRMPGMDGLQVAEKVRASQPWTPVVIVTGYGSPANEQRARALGVSGFMHKPLSPEMIEEGADKAVRTVFEGVAAPTEQMVEAAAAVMAETVEPRAEAAPRAGVLAMLKNMALFLASPFIGLVYAVLLPFVGMGMLLWVATEGLRKGKAPEAELVEQPAARVAAPAAAPVETAPAAAEAGEPQARGFGGAAMVALKLLAAPFAGLAFIVVMPFLGLGALAWMGLKAAFVRAE